MHHGNLPPVSARIRRSLIIGLMILSYGLLSSGSAPAFNMVDVANPLDCGFLDDVIPSFFVTDIGKSHREIVKEAITQLDNDRYGPIITQQMQVAMDYVADETALVDVFHMHDKSAHVDGESFSSAQLRVLHLANDIYEALNVAKDPFTARLKLGQALHTVQDFYAHSSWINDGHRDVHPEFGRQPAIPVSGSAGSSTNTCDATTHSSLITPLLTTGFYGGTSGRPPDGISKCFHGGRADSLGYAGINKDTTSSCHTPDANHNLHAPAAEVAILATRKFIEELEPFVGADGLNLVLGGSPLTFQNANASSSVGVDLKLDAYPSFAPFLAAGQTFPYPNLPPLATGDLHTFKVQGISSASATGIIFYRLHLPSHLEFVEYSSNLGGPFPIEGGQDFGQRLLLHPVSGPAEFIHTIKVRVIGG